VSPRDGVSALEKTTLHLPGIELRVLCFPARKIVCSDYGISSVQEQRACNVFFKLGETIF
jgi:hypothetical protein